MKARLPRIGLYAGLAIILLIVIFPFWWMVDTSFKHPVDIFGDVTLYPHNPTGDNYRRLFDTYHFGSYLMNSVCRGDGVGRRQPDDRDARRVLRWRASGWRGGSTSRRSWWRCSCG